MRFKNTSETTLNLSLLGVPDIGLVAPGEEVEVPDYLAQPGVRTNGTRQSSTIETLAPQLRPADPEEEAIWLLVPAPEAPQSRLRSVVGHVPAGPASPGVAAARAAKARRKAESAESKE